MKMKSVFYRILLSVLFLMLFSTLRNNSVFAVQSGDDFLNPIIISEPPTYNWTQTSLVSSESLNDTSHPSQVVDSEGNVHIVWADETAYVGSGLDSDIFYRYLSIDTGIWSSIELVSSNSTLNSYTPEIAIDNNDRISVVWIDETPFLRTDDDLDVFLAYKDGILGDWSNMEQVSIQSTEDSFNPSVAVDDFGSIYIVWEDETNYLSCGLDLDIFFKEGNISTGFWLPTEVISTESSEDSVEPFIAVDSQRNLHIVWSDYTDFGIADDYIMKRIVHKYRDNSDLSWSSLKVLSKTFESDIPEIYPFGDYFVYNYLPIIRIDNNDDIHLAYYNLELYSILHTMVPPDKTNSSLTYTKISSVWLKLDPELPPPIGYFVETRISRFAHPTLDYHYIEVTDSTIYSRPAFSVDSQLNIHIAFPATLVFISMMRVYISDIVFYLQLNSTNTHMLFTVNSTLSSTPTLSTDLKGRINLIWQDYLYHNESDTHLDIFLANCIVAPLEPILVGISQFTGRVTLNWIGFGFVDNYYILRDTKLISPYSANFLDPIAKVSTENYTDSLVVEDVYYYAIIGSNSCANSTVSNCLSIDVKIGFINNFDVNFWTFTSIVGTLSVVSVVSVVFNIKLRRP